MKTRAIILAGGEGSRLGVLTAKRTKPAVPFGGKYRIIDFTLSNCVNSGIFDVMLLAQYRPHSLIEHIGSGGPWDLDRDFTGGIRIYTPYKARRPTDWYLGTADAVQQNFTFIKSTNPDLVLILSGDHIYEMNYDAMIAFHLDHRADLTIATIRVPISEASRFGIISVNEEYQVTSFIEKPAHPESNLVNMGVYLFNLDTLDKVLWEDYQRQDSDHDFGKNIIPRLITEGSKVYAFPFSGYWVDVGTVESYWEAHMDLLQHPPSLDLNDRSWIIHTRTEERPPVRIDGGSDIINSMISDGCVIESGALIEQSILGPGVRIGKNAKIVNSVLMTDVTIEENAVITKSILDKRVVVEKDAAVGMADNAENLTTMIGKNSLVPSGMIIKSGAIIHADIRKDDYPSMEINTKSIIAKSTDSPHEI